MSSPIALRDYQRDCLDAVLSAEQRGVTRQLLALPTGSGKTVIAAHAVRDIALPRGWRTVFVVHRDELVRQTKDSLLLVNPGLRIGVVQAEQNETDRPVVVASAQTIVRPNRIAPLCNRGGQGLLLISDEAHHDRAEGRLAALSRLSPSLTLGMTATPERGDGLGLGEVYQEVVYQLPMLTLVARGLLARLLGVRVGTDVSLDGVHTVAGELNQGELETVVDAPVRNALVVQAYQRFAHDRRRTVVFCVSVAHAEHVRDAFLAAGVTADAVFGHTPSDTRQAILRRFAAGLLPVLVNVGVLTEGYDEPQIDCIVMARPTKSRGLYIQCVGRGARPHHLKPNCLILDVVDVSTRHKLAGISLLTHDPDDEDRDAAPIPTDEVVDILETVQGRQNARRARMARTSRAVDLFGGSEWLWRPVGGVYMAPAGRGAWLALQAREDSAYQPLLIERREGERPTAQSLSDTPLSIDLAMAVAETAAARFIPPGELHLARRSAPWRQAPLPPTPAQKMFAERMGVPVTESDTRSSLSLRLDDAVFLTTWRRVTT